MLNLLNAFGLFVRENNALPYNYTTNEYTVTASDKIKVHRDFLKSIEAEENARLGLIEAKTSQVISQTGIIFSLLSLFIPIFIDKITSESIIIKVIFIFFLISSYFFYILTIYNAVKNYNIKKFIYSKSSPTNVITYQNLEPDEFYRVEVKDLLYSININLSTNNQKATNLIYAYNSFRLGNIFTAFLGVFLCLLLLFSKPDDKSVNIVNPVEIHNFEPLMNTLIKTLKMNQRDSIILDSIPNK